MKTIYIYVLDTLADWELGYVTSELNSRRFFKTDEPAVRIKTISYAEQPITTMGGMTIVPDGLVEEVALSDASVLLLPGADTWNEPQHEGILLKAKALLAVNGTVGAICGATAALANAGVLDNRLHTSNDLEFLEMVCPNYTGQAFYKNQPSVADNHLITAGSTEALMWTKDIIEQLGVFHPETLTAWYHYFSTGEARYYFELMQTLPTGETD